MAESSSRPALTDYAAVAVIFIAYGILLARLTGVSGAPPAPEKLIGPMLAQVTLTAVVWVAMILARNVAILLGRASVKYYADYKSEVPDEVIERPARAFNNLMQVPTLFYVVCVLMIVTRRVDAAQLALAWLFAATRLVHAAIYIALNRVPYRFAAWICSCLALVTL